MTEKLMKQAIVNLSFSFRTPSISCKSGILGDRLHFSLNFWTYYRSLGFLVSSLSTVCKKWKIAVEKEEGSVFKKLHPKRSFGHWSEDLDFYIPKRSARKGKCILLTACISCNSFCHLINSQTGDRMQHIFLSFLLLDLLSYGCNSLWA